MPFKKGTSGNPIVRPKGSAMYVSKYVCDTKTNWGIVNNNS